MEKIDKAIEILQAYKEGKTIERNSDNPYKLHGLDIILGFLQSNPDDLRIAKEPKYMPYVNVEDFLRDSKKHGPYCKMIGFDIAIIPDWHSAVLYIKNRQGGNNAVLSTGDFLSKYVWQDGTPCGVPE